MQKTLNSEFFPRYSSGSVVAEVELKFERSVPDPLKPLEDEIKDGKFGSFTVSRELDLNPSKACATSQLDTILPFYLSHNSVLCTDKLLSKLGGFSS